MSAPTIRSLSNPYVKFVRSLRLSKYRRRHRRFVIEGIRIVKEAFELAAPIDTLIVCPDLLVSDVAQTLLRQAHASGIPCRFVSKKVFEHLSEREGPQGLMAVVRQTQASLDELPLHEDSLFLIAHEIQDPGNLGTMIRTADAAGASFILTGNATDWYDPKAVRASMGSLFAVPRTHLSHIEQAITWCRERDVQVVATSAHATHPYYHVDYTRPTAFLLGNEARGLPLSAVEQSDIAVRIPMVGRADSLNVAVAAALFLFEARRQRDTSAKA